MPQYGPCLPGKRPPTGFRPKTRAQPWTWTKMAGLRPVLGLLPARFDEAWVVRLDHRHLPSHLKVVLPGEKIDVRHFVR